MNPLWVPIVLAQGLRVRRTTEPLPPAAGPVSGVAGAEIAAPPLRIAVVGESTAAGCGALSHDQAFPGFFAGDLARRTDRAVRWTVAGADGATSRRIRYRLVPQVGSNLDLTVLLAGVNDVLSRRKPAHWRADLTAILEELLSRSRLVVMTGVPSFGHFPSLPTALGRYLDERAHALDVVSREVCTEHPRATWITTSPAAVGTGPDFFAGDGFHPSPLGYRRWAGSVAEQLPDATIAELSAASPPFPGEPLPPVAADATDQP